MVLYATAIGDYAFCFLIRLHYVHERVRVCYIQSCLGKQFRVNPFPDCAANTEDGQLRVQLCIEDWGQSEVNGAGWEGA